MTFAEKIKMYEEKKAFINNISKAFEGRPVGSTVEFIEYEAYSKEIARDKNIYRIIDEFVIVHFSGGAKSVEVVNGNSNVANFVAVGSLLNGGHYEKNQYYESVVNSSATKIV